MGVDKTSGRKGMNMVLHAHVPYLIKIVLPASNTRFEHELKVKTICVQGSLQHSKLNVARKLVLKNAVE